MADVLAVAAGGEEAAAVGGEVTKGAWRAVGVIRIPMPFPEPWGHAVPSFPRGLTQ